MSTVAQPSADPQRPHSRARAVALYNSARLGLFAVCVLLGYVAGLRGLLLLAAALLVSGVLSYFLLARQRIAMGMAVEEAIREQRRRLAERTAAEDRADDVRRAAETAALEDRSAASADEEARPAGGEPPAS